ncbi:MAG: diacylglycerol kinase family protein [Kofleriaceae bacterium]|nr:diacylglycerol kinase family protein [Kofleriaceae bacterium]
MSKRMKVAILINAAAGSIGSEKFDEKRGAIEAAVTAAGMEPTTYASEPAHLTQTARRVARSGIHAVIAAGGDGTVSAVAAGLAGSEMPLAVLPLGTLNHFAKDIGMPLDLEAAARAIADGRMGHVDIGELNGRPFVNNSSIGLYPEMVLDRDETQRAGRSKWIAMVLASLRVLRRFPLLRVVIGTMHGSIVAKTPFVFVGNNSYRVDALRLGARERLDQGELSLYMVRSTSRLKMFWLMVRAILQRLRAVQDFEFHQVGELTIRSGKHRLHVALDGEVMPMAPPLSYRIRPHALAVILPPAAERAPAIERTAS